jgi:pantoate--beta-alanine ligase
MRIIYKLEEMTETARGWLAGGAVGFVPTMGYLHQGHIALIEAARQECEISVVSIFVNQMQFDRHESFTQYPRNMARDLQLLNKAHVDVLFLPRAEEIYPPNFSTYVAPSGSVAERLEGVTSPAYIRGVSTIITKLFQLVRPDIVYFGQKDAQQVAVVRQLIRDLNIDVNLRVVPTVRESDGLAMSSQSHLLSPAERKAARIVYRALLAGKTLVEKHERRPSAIEKAMADLVATEPLVQLDYAAVCHPDTMNELDDVRPRCMLAIAARIGSIRLIDNFVWQEKGRWQM